MEEQEKTYTKEQVKEIIEESVKQVKEASRFATVKTFKNIDDRMDIEMLSTAVIEGMEKTLKAKFDIKPQRKVEETVIEIKSKEELKDAIMEIVNAIFAD